MRRYKNLENFYCCRSDKVSMVLAIVAEFRAKDQVERILLESTTDTILNTIMSNRESGCGVKANRKAAVGGSPGEQRRFKRKIRKYGFAFEGKKVFIKN